LYASPSWSGYLNAECVSTIQKSLSKSVKNLNGLLLVNVVQAVDMFAVHVEKLFSGMCRLSGLVTAYNHLLPSKRDTGHNLRHRGHSYQLVSYNFSSTRRCFIVRMLFERCKHLRLSDVNKHTYLLTYRRRSSSCVVMKRAGTIRSTVRILTPVILGKSPE